MLDRLRMIVSNDTIKVDSALIMVAEIYRFALTRKSDSLIFQSIYSIAELYSRGNSRMLALEKYFQALQKLELDPNLYGPKATARLMVNIYSNIGYNYYELKMNNKSQQFYARAMAIIDTSEKIHPGTFPLRIRAIMYYNIGSLMMLMDNLDYSRKLCAEGVDLNRKMNNDTLRAGFHTVMGLICKKGGDLAGAKVHYDNALRILEAGFDKNMLVALYNNFGEYYNLAGDKETAVAYYVKAFRTGMEIKASRSVQIAADELCDLYAEKQDYKESYRYHHVAKKINDSLFNDENFILSTNLSEVYEISHRMSKFESDHNTAQSEYRHHLIILFTGLVILVLLLIIISLFLYNLSNKHRTLQLKNENQIKESELAALHREQLKHDLDYRNRLLATNALNMERKSEFIQMLQERLQDVMKDIPEKSQQVIYEIIGDLRRNLNTNDWQEFELRFQEIHPDFFTRLTDRFPSLSPADLKLAALLRLNMSSKDIAGITSRTVDSIKISRCRLRKKLDMPNDKNVVIFLQEF